MKTQGAVRGKGRALFCIADSGNNEEQKAPRGQRWPFLGEVASSVGNQGMRVCARARSGRCDKRVARGHLNRGDMRWYFGSSAFTEARKRPKIVPLAPELLIPGGQHETAQRTRRGCTLVSGEDVLPSGELDPFDVKSPDLSLQFRGHTSLRNTILCVHKEGKNTYFGV